MAKYIGTIKCFFPEKSFGFITDSKTERDLYFNEAALREELLHMPANELVGKPVVFRAGTNAKGLKAVEVVLDNKALKEMETELHTREEIKAEDNIKPNDQEQLAKRQNPQKQSHKQISQSEEPVSSSDFKDEIKVNESKKVDKGLSRLEMYKKKSDAVTMKLLKVTKLDNPKTIELIKVKVTNFALMQQYRFKIGFSNASLAFVRTGDRCLSRIEKMGKSLSKTKRPNLKSI